MPLSIVHHPDYHAELAEGHRFPMGKFRRLAEVLVEEGLVAGPSAFVRPEEPPAEWIARAHDERYVGQIYAVEVPKAVEREIGFPITGATSRRAQLSASGTATAGRLALVHGIAANTAGGSHHARFSGGAGFCVFNDVAVAIRALQAEGLIERAMVIDCDVHQGDGTAEIFAADERVFTLSVHGENNYPAVKANSDLDLALPDETGDRDYIRAVRAAVPKALRNHRPDIVFYNAGVDPHADDRLGRLKLSDGGLIERDRYVIDAVREAGVPLAGVIGGGYSDDLDALARRHSLLFRAAAEFV
ncbi:histone deacetylase [Pseudoxanthobacter sp.]|uniref:histone deacetylase family protein n=1 Tax=Pseudoxanthobacter sp. TaxID=1925742 RepID=UPI002FDF5BB4